jgi:hypothetical protein
MLMIEFFRRGMWDVVDAGESLVFTIFASKDDGAHALDFNDGAITKFDSANDCSVNFSKGVAMARHVIYGTGVEVPALDSLVVVARPEEGFCLRLVDVERGMLWSCSGVVLHHYGWGWSNLFLQHHGSSWSVAFLHYHGWGRSDALLTTTAGAGVVQTYAIRSAGSSSSSSAWAKYALFLLGCLQSLAQWP